MIKNLLPGVALVAIGIVIAHSAGTSPAITIGALVSCVAGAVATVASVGSNR